MQLPMPRRRFLKRGAATAVAVAALASRVSLVSARERQVPYYKLSPCSHAGVLTRLDQTNSGYDKNQRKNSQPDCQACHACHNHDYYKIMRSSADADQNRAHDHCNCSVYLAGTIDISLWNQLFADGPVVDQRSEAAQEILGGRHL